MTMLSVETNPDQLYVLLLLDGHSYGRIGMSMSHGPEKQRLYEVRDINEATAQLRYQWKRWMKHGVLVPVEVSRKVTIIPG